jgi:hydroxyethylthiazole kinase-like uncharacterized protein yjeF
MKILNAEEMRATDRVTAEVYGATTLELMEHAGQAVARLVLREYPDKRRITVLCGKGNNGGDGFVAARMLAEAGCEVAVLLLGTPEDLKGDARTMYERMGLEAVKAPTEEMLAEPAVGLFIDAAELLIDAVVGTGFKPPLRGVAAALGQRIEALSTPVVAVDLPSGWDADAREYAVEGAYRADAVVTFTAPKLAHVSGDLVRSATKPIVVARIGSPEEAIVSSTGLSWAGSSKQMTEQPRPSESNKGKYGHVLVIGGSRGKTGAPSMASLAALRTGAGLVTAAVAESSLSTVALTTPELMTAALKETSAGDIARSNLESLEALLARKTVLAVGPGMGQAEETASFLLGLLERTEIPMVLDADGLNILAAHLDVLKRRKGATVLTPHPGEMARLTGKSIAEVQADRDGIAREFAQRHSVTLVLKGWRTLIAHPDGAMAVNTTGNPGMAKGGSGDILTGIVAAMVAQYPDRLADAVNAAVYVHGLAADFAVCEHDEHTLLATDTVAHLSSAFRFRAEGKDGYVWIQGIPRAERQ